MAVITTRIDVHYQDVPIIRDAIEGYGVSIGHRSESYVDAVIERLCADGYLMADEQDLTFLISCVTAQNGYYQQVLVNTEADDDDRAEAEDEVASLSFFLGELNNWHGKLLAA